MFVKVSYLKKIDLMNMRQRGTVSELGGVDVAAVLEASLGYLRPCQPRKEVVFIKHAYYVSLFSINIEINSAMLKNGK